ncbi:hypothetical protein HK102_013429 [Quaeritorhiza haematococci]|nr:hypothetical protein HK102_013429 [Quaeritorhiza haematococci]
MQNAGDTFPKETLVVAKKRSFLRPRLSSGPMKVWNTTDGKALTDTEGTDGTAATATPRERTDEVEMEDANTNRSKTKIRGDGGTWGRNMSGKRRKGKEGENVLPTEDKAVKTAAGNGSMDTVTPTHTPVSDGPQVGQEPSAQNMKGLRKLKKRSMDSLRRLVTPVPTFLQPPIDDAFARDSLAQPPSTPNAPSPPSTEEATTASTPVILAEGRLRKLKRKSVESLRKLRASNSRASIITNNPVASVSVATSPSFTSPPTTATTTANASEVSVPGQPDAAAEATDASRNMKGLKKFRKQSVDGLKRLMNRFSVERLGALFHAGRTMEERRAEGSEGVVGGVEVVTQEQVVTPQEVPSHQEVEPPAERLEQLQHPPSVILNNEDKVIDDEQGIHVPVAAYPDTMDSASTPPASTITTDLDNHDHHPGPRPPGPHPGGRRRPARRPLRGRGPSRRAAGRERPGLKGKGG